MNRTLFVLIFLLGGVILAGCNSQEKRVAQKAPAPQVETVHADGVRRITIKDFEELRNKHDVFIVDVRNQAAYDQGHIPGAKLMPVNEILNHVDQLPKDRLIVTYCS